MSKEFLPNNRLTWTHDDPKRPIWPGQPDVDKIRTLTLTVLRRHFPNFQSEEKSLKVTSFAERLTKKLFVVSHPELEKKYIFQVQLPVDPFFNTESEVATISYLRHNTDIPVPALLAWNSSSDNILGYEWSLIEMLDGVPLGCLWNRMSLEAKLNLAESLGRIMSKLWSQKFDHIGSLYMKQRTLDAIEFSLEDLSSFHTYFEDVSSPSFKVGEMVSMPFFVGRRCFLPSNRGPFKSSKRWMKAQIRLELQYVLTGQEILQLSPELCPEDINLQSTFLETLEEFQNVCHDYLMALPSVFRSKEKQQFSLYHHGLNEENILLDPLTYHILGILDWDMTSVLPDWSVREHSRIFHDISPANENHQVTFTSAQTSGSDFQEWYVCPIRLPQQEHGQLLQRRLDETLEKYGVEFNSDDEKRIFYSGVLHLGRDYELSKQYLTELSHFRKEYRQLGWSNGFNESSWSESE